MNVCGILLISLPNGKPIRLQNMKAVKEEIDPAYPVFRIEGFKVSLVLPQNRENNLSQSPSL